MTSKLSFCIPTRNRAHIISECLDSILDQLNGRTDIQIVVVDGGSTDNTADVISKYISSFENIVYFRRDECVGVDRDILEAVNLANGEYCWLMSDDDKLESGALNYVLDLIIKNPVLAGISVNITAYDKRMMYQIQAVPSIAGNAIKENFLFDDRDDCFSKLGVHFGFLSAQIVNRKIWNLAVRDHVLDGFCNAWLLVYIIGRMLELEPHWLYVHAKLVGYRSGNDSFIAHLGVFRRQEITHNAYEKIIRELFGFRSKVYNQVFYTILSDRMARSLAVIKADGCPFIIQYRLFRLYFIRYWYFPLYWVKVFPIFFVPNFIFRILRKFYFYFKKNSYSAAVR